MVEVQHRIGYYLGVRQNCCYCSLVETDAKAQLLHCHIEMAAYEVAKTDCSTSQEVVLANQKDHCRHHFLQRSSFLRQVLLQHQLRYQRNLCLSEVAQMDQSYCCFASWEAKEVVHLKSYCHLLVILWQNHCRHDYYYYRSSWRFVAADSAVTASTLVAPSFEEASISESCQLELYLLD